MSDFRDPIIGPGSLNPSLRFRVPTADGVRSGRSWAIASANGGTGRSTLAAMLGSRLVHSGFTTCIVDADWTSPMMSSMVGLPAGSTSSIWRTDEPLQVERSPAHQDLSLLVGASPSTSSPSMLQCSQLHERLSALPHKQLVLDLPAGCHDAALDLWLGADFPLLLAVPERLPLEATARLLARVFARQALPMLSKHLGTDEARALLDTAWNECAGRTGTWMRTVARLAGLDPDELSAQVGSKPIHLVLNRLRRADDIDVGHALVTAAGHGLGIDLRFRAALPYQDEGWIGARRLSASLHSVSDSNANPLKEEVDELLERMSSDTEVPQPGSWRWNLQGDSMPRTAEP